MTDSKTSDTKPDTPSSSEQTNGTSPTPRSGQTPSESTPKSSDKVRHSRIRMKTPDEYGGGFVIGGVQPPKPKSKPKT